LWSARRRASPQASHQRTGIPRFSLRNPCREIYHYGQAIEEIVSLLGGSFMPDFVTLRLTWEPRMLSILRIMVGLLFMEHGLAKVLGFPLQPNHAPYALLTLNPGLQGMLELVGGLLLALGLFTRTVAFVLAGNMAVAYFMVHAPRGFFPLLNGGELAIVYCFIFLYFWVAGGGEWSLDRLRAPASTSALSPSRA
jgi:putative oxidoreductase